MPKADNLEQDHPPTVPQAVADLVLRFEQQLPAYTSGQYNEAQVRQEFLNPLFEALGWDMDNEQGYIDRSAIATPLKQELLPLKVGAPATS